MTDASPALKLHELIRTVASRLGDCHMLEATDGTTTTLVDTLNITTGMPSFSGRQIMISSGTNEGQARLVANTDHATSTISFGGAALGAAIVAGVSAFAVNAKGGGFTLLEYKEHLNEAVRSVRGIARVSVVSTNLSVDSSTQTLAIPDTMSEVYAVEWLDQDGITWSDLSGANMRGNDGWWVDETNSTIILDPFMSNYYHGMTVRLRGEGKHDDFTTYTSTSRIHPRYLVSRACYTLGLMGIDRDVHGNRRTQVPQFQRESEAELAIVRTRREPTSVGVRQD